MSGRARSTSSRSATSPCRFRRPARPGCRECSATSRFYAAPADRARVGPLSRAAKYVPEAGAPVETTAGSRPRVITAEAAAGRLSWPAAVEALRAGHRLPRAEAADMMLGPAEATLLSRGAFIPGLGYGVKSVTVVDGNAARGLPTVQGAMLVFDPETGALDAIVESRPVTALKTAADSVLGALCLARPESAHLLIVGAGAVARSLVPAYAALFPRPRARVGLGAAARTVGGPRARSRRRPRSGHRRPRPGDGGGRSRHHRLRHHGPRARAARCLGASRHPRRPDRRLQGRHARGRRRADRHRRAPRRQPRHHPRPHRRTDHPDRRRRHHRRGGAGRPLRPRRRPGRAPGPGARSPSTRTAAGRTST